METEAEVETNALGLAPDWYRQEQADAALPEEQPEEPAPSITASASPPRRNFLRPGFGGATAAGAATCGSIRSSSFLVQ